MDDDDYDYDYDDDEPTFHPWKNGWYIILPMKLEMVAKVTFAYNLVWHWCPYSNLTHLPTLPTKNHLQNPPICHKYDGRQVKAT